MSIICLCGALLARCKPGEAGEPCCRQVAKGAELAMQRQAVADLPGPAPLLLAGPAAPRNGPTACRATAGLSSILAARGAP